MAFLVRVLEHDGVAGLDLYGFRLEPLVGHAHYATTTALACYRRVHDCRIRDNERASKEAKQEER